MTKATIFWEYTTLRNRRTVPRCGLKLIQYSSKLQSIFQRIELRMGDMADRMTKMEEKMERWAKQPVKR